MENSTDSYSSFRKAEAALKVLKGASVEEVAEAYGAAPESVAQWAADLETGAVSIFDGENGGAEDHKLDHYRSLLDSISRNVQEAILRSTPSEGLVYVNNAFLQMFGYDSQEEVMNIRPELFYANQSRRWELMEKMKSLGRITNEEIRFRRKDGSEFWGLENSSLVRNNGEVFIDGIIHDITERKEFESRIQTSLKEKEVLLGEIHHRVKNNLAVISGLLYLQAEKTGDGNARELLNQSQSRINSMAIVHEMLYDNKTFSRIDPARYIEQLVHFINLNLGSEGKPVDITVDAGSIELDINTAIPCALILNELLTNSYKYAFRDREQGSIDVQFRKRENRYQLTVSDDGVGIPKEVLEKGDEQHSLGLFIVHTLVEQLNGTIDLDTGSGSRFRITFPDPLHR